MWSLDHFGYVVVRFASKLIVSENKDILYVCAYLFIFYLYVHSALKFTVSPFCYFAITDICISV